ncbi:MAG: DUF503 domain-containing protein [candidate division Zixibacteria bacterium]|nr:DUF503 domain-containing protein [candidate division Zixibacteria bacterium]
MFVGTVVFDLNLSGVTSLKEKRRMLKPFLARLQNQFHISIAEVGYNDSLRMAQVGVAVVSNERTFADRMIAQIVNNVRNEPEIILADYRVEIL